MLSADGSCIVVGGPTVSDSYGPDERCVVVANGRFGVSASRFATEAMYDTLRVIDGMGVELGVYSGSIGPAGLEMAPGGYLVWLSDSSIQLSGFELCATSPAPSLPPLPPTAPGATFSFDYDGGVGWSTGPTQDPNGQPVGAPPYGWHRRDGATPSSSTGPTSGYGGAGSYYYIEASSPRGVGDVFELEYDGGACAAGLVVRSVRFWFHMRGSSMGSLEVVTSDGAVVWREEKEQGTEWQHAAAEVHASGFKFRATRGTSWKSDIAVDQVTVACGAPRCALALPLQSLLHQFRDLRRCER